MKKIVSFSAEVKRNVSFPIPLLNTKLIWCIKNGYVLSAWCLLDPNVILLSTLSKFIPIDINLIS